MGDLVLQNVIHVTTQNGQCQVELLTGDITKLTLEEKVDMVMVSAFPGDYQASHGTLIAALDHELGISVRKLAMDKEMDLRKHFHCWLSKPLPKHIPYTRLLCFERQMTHIGVHPAALVGDVFRGLTPIFNNHDSSIITPLLATGDQKFSLSVMMRAMVDAACNWMKAGLPLRCLKIVLFTRTPDSLTKQDQEVVSLFTKLKHKWEKRGASLKVSSMQYDIYISYSHKDAQLVTVVRKLIEKKHGALRIFSEKQEIWAELAWQEAMFEKMTACKRIVALLSPSYLESSECMEQFNIALCCTRLQTHTLLAPLYVETVPTMPAYMQLVQYIDCREDPPELTIEIQLGLACDLIANSISENSSATEGELVDTIYAYDIFISYSHRHPQEAEHLVDAFSQNCPDTKVFFDRSGLETGKSWQKTLYSVLGRVRCVVAMVTTPYLESSVCQEEYNIALYRAMTQVEDFLFIPICIDADLNALPVEFAAVRPLDGRGPSFPSLTEELQRDVVSWLKDGKRTPLFPPVEVVKDVNSITKRCRQEQVRKQYLMQKHLLESNSLMPKNGDSDNELPKPGILVKPYEKPSCDVYFCFSQNDTRLAAILGHMITGNSPDLNVSLGVGTPQERLQKLDTAKLIVVFVSQTFMASGQLSDALHMSLCRRRAEENPFLVYSILSSSLDLDPVFLHLLPYDLSLIDSLWEELGTEDQKIFSHRTVVAKGELQGSYRCSHSELLALKKAALDITENMTRIRSESAPSAPQLSVNFINIERERRRLKKLPIHTIVPLKQALWQWAPSRPKNDGKVVAESLATDAETQVPKTKDISVPVQNDTVAGGSVEVLSGVDQSGNKTSGCVPCVEKKTNTNASHNAKKTNTNASDKGKKMKANTSEDTQKTNTNASDNTKKTNTNASDNAKKTNTNASEVTQKTNTNSLEDTQKTDTNESDDAKKTNTNASEDTQKTNTNASDNARAQKPSHRRSNACALL